MKYLVTGGAGFIGSHIIQHLLKCEYEVLCLDNFDPCYDILRKRANISPFLQFKNFELVEGDIRDEELLQKIAQDTECIFHEAAQVSVAESMKNPVKTIETNTIGTLKVLRAAMKCNVKKIIVASSAAVYGDLPENPKKENMLPSPKSPYAISKLDCEYFAKIFYEEYGLRTTTLRYFNVYGPRQDPTSPYAAAIPIFIRHALKNDNIVIFGDGSQTRDFVYVKDVVQANELVMSKGDGKILNVANASAISIIDLARLIIELMGSSSKIVFKEPRTGDIKHSLADISDISEVGFKPNYDLKKGLIETIEWFKKNG